MQKKLMNYFLKEAVSAYHFLFYFYEIFGMPRPTQEYYKDMGYFYKNDPYTRQYRFSNWGSRKWEYRYAQGILEEIGIKDKNVVDVGIGIPSDYDFYKYYLKSGCHLWAFDPDGRLPKVLNLSEKCRIFNKSAEKINIPPKSCDVVVCISAFEHFPFRIFQKTVKEVYRILKKNGHFIITLDLTHDKKKSARWAILEKTLNGLPEYENDIGLKTHDKQLTLTYFLDLISPHFYIKDKQIRNNERSLSDIVFSQEWNSYVGYLHLYKR
ncbi:class I SAM-dependent methyltransferase [Patescibacteria group bacterium]|nr:class I SAM-dependent methyltransferase [Patescibacteria group bacterium]MCL5798057.1 class I SAM-dependent methyltransferase [Patescibacteria group bacterium]